ncbi:MAG: pentapeptide repeat-containing protein [Candidatus Promineifilaceae bacterium]|jgi:uncharacterized protein YjbI with pentapeptide repeats
MSATERNQAQELENRNAWGRWQNWSIEHAVLGFIAAVMAVFLLILLAVIIFWALFPHTAPAWTGFNETTHPLYTGISPSKTLWDWLGLLIIPLFLAIGAAWIGRMQQTREMRAHAFEQMQADQDRENDWAIEMDRQEQVLMDRYFERITHYLLDFDLRSSSGEDEIRTIARASTLAVLRLVNAQRKGMVIQFLYETGLISTPRPVIELEGANLHEMALESADLHGAHLAGTDMDGARLDHANLSGANLAAGNLIEAQLRGADLTDLYAADAYLSSAHLQKAILKSAVLTNTLLNNASLIQADLREADLQGTNLVGADLSQANLAGANLSEAKVKPSKTAVAGDEDETVLVNEAVYDAATIWPEAFDPDAGGAVLTN